MHDRQSRESYPVIRPGGGARAAARLAAVTLTAVVALGAWSPAGAQASPPPKPPAPAGTDGGSAGGQDGKAPQAAPGKDDDKGNGATAGKGDDKGEGTTAGKPARKAEAAEAGAAEAKSPTAEEVAVALADLAQGLKAETAAERVEVVARNAGVADAKVVKALGKYLKDKEPSVRLATLAALGVTAHADALKELQRLLADAKFMADNELAAAALLATGRHAAPASVKVLAKDAWKNPAQPVARARLLALGNIRTKDAVEALMELMNTEPTLPWDASPYMQDFRLALARLTGVDKGVEKDAWRAWWSEAGKSLKVSPEPPKLPFELQSSWDAFWALPAR